MAYTVNGKIYTDHSLLDEIVYNTKLILNGIVIKNNNLADSYENEHSVTQSDILLAIRDGSIELSFFPLTEQMLKDYGYTTLEATVYASDWTTIPVEDRESVLSFCSQYFLDNYVETNNYYRMLNGEPEYGTGDTYYVYIDPNDTRLKSEDIMDIQFDFTKPIHEFNIDQLNTIESVGILDELLNFVGTNAHFRYLKYLGAKKIDYYSARSAGFWDILYMPMVETMVVERFKELYNINRDIYYKKTYRDAYAFESTYYDEIVMLLIICQTFTDMIVDVPEWYIRRDIFDLRTCQYFLESQGVKFFKEIPLKYQIRLVKNLNKLIRYKSTERNIDDILEVFSVEGTTVYKYYLFKRFKRTIYEKSDDGVYIPTDVPFEMEDEYEFGDEDTVDGIMDMTGAMIYDFIDENHDEIDPTEVMEAFEFGDEDGDVAEDGGTTDYKEEKKEAAKVIVDECGNIYTLEFVRVPIGENYDDYIKDNTYRDDYDIVTMQDPYWDGEDIHSYIKNQHLMRDFTIESTKYMSLDYKISMEEYTAQMAYFLTLIFQTELDMNDILLSLPSIKSNTYFNLRNLFILLYCLSGLYSDRTQYIRLPKTGHEALDDSLGIYHDELTERYDWLRTNYPYMWVDLEGRILGFNLSVDLEELEEQINIRHSKFGFYRGFTLRDLGCDTYITTNRITTMDELINVYRTNLQCYKTLKDLMINADTKDDRRVYQYVYDTLFTTDYPYEFYKLSNGNDANTYLDILKERDYTLYRYYKTLEKEPDKSVRQDMVRGALNDIVDTLEYYLKGEDLKYVMSFAPTHSLDTIIKYIDLVIDFFKSWKVYFLDPVVSYWLADRTENTAEHYDTLSTVKINQWYEDIAARRDIMAGIHIYQYTEDRKSDRNKEVIDIYGHYEPEKVFKIYDGRSPIDESDDSINSNYRSITEDLPIISGYYDLDGASIQYTPDSIAEGREKPVPFFQVNGGEIAARLNVDDLDGGGPIDMQYYLTVDGKNCLDRNPILASPASFDGEEYTYDVNGGPVSVNDIITPSMITHVRGNVVTADVRISRYTHNGFGIDEEGLYIPDIYADVSDYDEMVADLNKTRADYIALLENYEETVGAYGSYATMSELVDNIFREYFEKSKLYLNDIHNNTTYLNIQSYANNKAYELKQWFIELDVFGWDYF